ncbi:MAG TPA: LLM class flavin-dependent oxidoreductase [Candidatus Binataceae bacterium]|nr:LLM class flavin-dependent oxidoreductase [Candidatus Binataceae bacterium]
MEFGFALFGIEPAKVRDLAQTAEALNFDLILFPDHIVIESPERQYDPHALSFDSITMATLAAGATKRIKVGHLVLCNQFRHPIITAQSLMTLDHASGGRMLLGLGAGWTQTEFDMTGLPFPPIRERLEALDESLTCIRSLWTNERTTFEGKHYRFRDAILWPKPVQKHPPIILGGSGKGLLRIAAKHADYLNIIPDAGKAGKISIDRLRQMNDEVFRERVDFFRAEARRIGRDPDAIKISNALLVFMVVDTEAAARQMIEGIASAFNVSPEVLLASPVMMVGTPEYCAAELRRRAKNWGVTQFVFSSFLGMDEKQIRRVREEVIPQI